MVKRAEEQSVCPGAGWGGVRRHDSSACLCRVSASSDAGPRHEQTQQFPLRAAQARVGHLLPRTPPDQPLDADEGVGRLFGKGLRLHAAEILWQS